MHPPAYSEVTIHQNCAVPAIVHTLDHVKEAGDSCEVSLLLLILLQDNLSLDVSAP